MLQSEMKSMKQLQNLTKSQLESIIKHMAVHALANIDRANQEGDISLIELFTNLQIIWPILETILKEYPDFAWKIDLAIRKIKNADHYKDLTNICQCDGCAGEA